MHRFIFFFIFLLSLKTANSQVFKPDEKGKHWVDSILKSMTIEEKIGQMFMVATYPENNKKHYNDIINLIENYNIGGIIHFKSGPIKQAQMTNLLQSKSKIPLLVSIDAEWGLHMRIDSAMQFPMQMTLGAMQNTNGIYEMGKAIAQQCKRMGIHVNFAPVADINNNPQNPIINLRSFGDDRDEVTNRCSQYVKGMQDERVLAVIKHFPGHGDTQTDSHHDLPVINFSRERLDSLELYPFKKLINNDAGGVMIAHLYVPELDNTKNTATTLSKKVVTDLLKNEMGFNGLIFTDALNMKGVTKFFKPAEVDLMAMMAGNDVLLYAQDVPKALEVFTNALKEELISENDINNHVRKILEVKYWVGLNNYKPVNIDSLYIDLHKPEHKYINRKLAENSITLVRNNKQIIPLKRLDTLKIAALSIGDNPDYAFWERLKCYYPVETIFLSKKAEKKEFNDMLRKLSDYNLVIVSLSQTNRYAFKSFTFSNHSTDFINQLASRNNVILTLFSSPYSLNILNNPMQFQSIIMAYEPLDEIQDLSAQLIFGGIGAKGKLPVNISSLFFRGFGVETKATRLKYSMSEEFGIPSSKFNIIDTLVNNAIANKTFPGCQIWFAKDSKVIFNKSYGHHTYDSTTSVTNEHIYDLASLTKILASVPAVMKLYEDNQIGIDVQLGEFIPELRNSNKNRLKLGDVLAHQAGLQGWIPYHGSTVKTDSLRNFFYSTKQTSTYNYVTANNMYAHISLSDTILNRISRSNLRRNNDYLYSDLGFYLIPIIVKNITETNFDEYIYSNFYHKLGLHNLTYNPLNYFDIKNITPTENDKRFRKQLIHGYVHDQGAAILGGISGHAGLFSNANSVGVVNQMFLNNGNYGDEEYFKKETIRLFTSCFNCPKNRRGLGFDKPLPTKSNNNPAAENVSIRSFGHSGFTGTYAWADPDININYVFLSNRIHPDAENKKLIESALRTTILDTFINIFNKYDKNKEISEKK